MSFGFRFTTLIIRQKKPSACSSPSQPPMPWQAFFAHFLPDFPTKANYEYVTSQIGDYQVVFSRGYRRTALPRPDRRNLEVRHEWSLHIPQKVVSRTHHFLYNKKTTPSLI